MSIPGIPPVQGREEVNDSPRITRVHPASLATINGEALSISGLTFWGDRVGDRVALICSDEAGAVELRERPRSTGRLDGVLVIHSAREFDPPRWDGGPQEGCSVVPGGGGCWSDVTFLAYDRDFRAAIEAQDHAAVLRELADWHRVTFGGGA